MHQNILNDRRQAVVTKYKNATKTIGSIPMTFIAIYNYGDNKASYTVGTEQGTEVEN